MTTPAEILAADVADVLARLQTATGIKASAIVKGTGRANGEVPARHAAFWMLTQRGHGATAIADAFKFTRTGVLSSINRITIHGRPRDMAEKARRLKKPA